ncbi:MULTISPECIES: type 1 glutamine amidotransferase domain-containing protein [Paracoccus]|uniref:Type 1 glutamine amidotransferase n=2 Tax=Paracoccus TaxID=265 RepID=A0A386UGZ7_9RHOB|nr:MULTISPECIES: type 1 glutamine amidotransferase domain-containing protein [Paracoccus]AWX93468.1 type 1 glutamine amidotransferase [Paracoccus mutanolyticus]AYE99933.1 type 1 glutamine amidotransferase [Paracoccus yeei]MBY0135804.1 type 1 glutamine amidotransferase [Paracoccus yeei]OWJ93942.1 type 1 glutamine amidotransferase [Paracoccus yeei]QEU07805.1 type 1 glutamine amidotransferase [Paracoccus yeei]
MADVLIMASDGFEQSELFVPLEKLREAGHRVDIAAPEAGPIKAWDKKDWGKTVEAGLAIADARAGDYDVLVLPGGVINPDTLRQDDKAIALIRDFAAAGKPVAAICHAPWLLAEAGLAKGRRLTSYGSIRTDMKNAGAEVVDEKVVVDGGIITSRNPDDLDAFVGAIEEALG